MKTTNLGALILSWSLLMNLVPGATSATPGEATRLDFSPGVSITLTNQAAPVASGVWMRDGYRLQPGDHILISDSMTLRISNCSTNDAGFYQLLAGADLSTNAQYVVRVQTAEYQRTFQAGSTFTLWSKGQDSFGRQWTKDGEPIPGATDTSLTVYNAQPEDAGEYALICGTLDKVVNTIWRIAIEPPPPPPPAIVEFYHTTAGDNVKFVVVATGGEPLSYQWYWEDQPILGATANVLSYTNAATTANAGYYSVTVSNASGVVSTPPPGLLFVKSMKSGTYRGIFYDEQNTTVESSGAFQFTLSGTKKTYSGKLTSGGASYRFSGVFTPAHASVTRTAAGSDGRALDLQFHLLSTNGTSGVIGTVSDGTWTVPLRGNSDGYQKQNPTTLAGNYTLALNNVGLLSPGVQPQGSGCGTVTVGQSGSARVSGYAADGTPFSLSSYLSREDEFPVYVSLYKNQGCLVGWASFGSKTNSEWSDYFETLPDVLKDYLPSGNDLAQGTPHGGPIHWVKNSSTAGMYPGGFSLVLQPFGSKFQGSGSLAVWPPSTPGNVLPFQQGVAALALGDLFSAELSKWDFIRVSVPKLNTLRAETGPEQLKLSVGTGNGFIKGSFVHPDTGLRTALRAVLLQEQGYALGYFLSSGASGYFALVGQNEE